MSARRLLYITGVVALIAWIVVPIYLIALGAFSGRAGVFRWPKSLWPGEASFAAMQVFLQVEGVWKAALNSIIVAALCMLFSVLLGARRAMRWRASPSAGRRPIAF